MVVRVSNVYVICGFAAIGMYAMKTILPLFSLFLDCAWIKAMPFLFWSRVSSLDCLHPASSAKQARPSCGRRAGGWMCAWCGSPSKKAKENAKVATHDANLRR